MTAKIKLLLFFLVCLTLVFLKTSPVFAAPAPIVKELQDTNMNLGRWTIGTSDIGKDTRGVIDYILEGLTVKMIGATDDKGNLLSQGAVGTTIQAMSYLYLNKPVSSVRYIADLKQNIGIVKPAYAQVTGWVAMEPILPLWKLMRNVCYVFFVVIFVVVGFMIMFRNKIDNQTIASIQNSLPRIIIALILVTFSYAIAGLIIDINEIALGLIISIFRSQWAKNLPDLVVILQQIPAAIIGKPPTNVANIFTLIGPLIKSSDQMVAALQDLLSVMPVVGGIFSTPFLGSAVVSFVIGFAIFGAMIRTFFTLIGAYVTIVILTITSPFAFLVGALPGNGKAASSWFKSLLSNVLIFPATFLLLLLAVIFVTPPGGTMSDFPWSIATINPLPTAFKWYPVPLGIFWGKDTAGNLVSLPFFINYLLAFGIILILPKTAEVIKSVVEGEKGPNVSGELQGGLSSGLKNIPVIGSLLG